MSGIMRLGLRYVGTTRYITNNNPTKYLQSMCHVRNGFIHVPKNSFTSAQKKSAAYWEAISRKVITFCICTIPIPIAIIAYVTYKNMPGFLNNLGIEFGKMISEAEKTTVNSQYSIDPSTIVTSSVLFDDGEIQIKTQKDNIRLMNDNSRIFMGSKEMDASILEPFSKGKPIPIKVGKLDGLLDNGKLTLKTEDGDTTFTFHNTVGLEVKKLSEILQNEKAANEEEQHESIPTRTGIFNYSFLGSKTTLKTPETMRECNDERVTINGNCSFSFDTRIKIQKDNSDEVYYFKQMVHLECNSKSDEKTQNTFKISSESNDESTEEMKICDVIIDSGIIFLTTHDDKRRAVRQVLTCDIYEDAEHACICFKLTQKIYDIYGLQLRVEYF